MCYAASALAATGAWKTAYTRTGEGAAAPCAEPCDVNTHISHPTKTGITAFSRCPPRCPPRGRARGAKTHGSAEPAHSVCTNASASMPPKMSAAARPPHVLTRGACPSRVHACSIILGMLHGSVRGENELISSSLPRKWKTVLSSLPRREQSNHQLQMNWDGWSDNCSRRARAGGRAERDDR